MSYSSVCLRVHVGMSRDTVNCQLKYAENIFDCTFVARLEYARLI